MSQVAPLDFDSVPGLQAVAKALLEMVQKRRWGHVTVRFKDGEIRQVDSLVTVAVDEAAAPSLERPAA